MIRFVHCLVFCVFFILSGCGDDSGVSSLISSNNGAVLSSSETSLLFSGKQFGHPPEIQQITLTYDRDVVNHIDMTIKGDAEAEDGGIFRVSSDTDQKYAEVFTNFAGMEGGTYKDELTLTPSLKDGSKGTAIVIDLTLMQEPTERIIAEFNEAVDAPIGVTENGSSIRFAATVNTGNTIRWKVQPYSFAADGDDVDALTAYPLEGLGGDQIDLILLPTSALIDSIRENGSVFAIIGIEDIDTVGNVTEIGFEVTLEELEEQRLDCSHVYDPVCAQMQEECDIAPCPLVTQTFGNNCEAGREGFEVIYQGQCALPEEQRLYCPSVYEPVCAQKEEECDIAPCPLITQTFGNDCEAGLEGYEVIYQGQCALPEEHRLDCPTVYEPVCAQKEEECDIAQCPLITQTFSNDCAAGREGFEVIYQGQCD